MKTLYLDCGMGAAGDMLTAALLELFPNPDAVLAELNGLHVPGVRYEREITQKCGITGTHMHVYVGETEEGEHHHHHHHDHDHTHSHDHHHGSMHEIEHWIDHMEAPETVKENVWNVFHRIAEVESQVHGMEIEHVHFHEVGSLDALADVTAVCYLMHKLYEQCGVQRVAASPVHVGSGHVFCAHGILPVPAPATALLLKGVPIYGGQIQGELCTPTGAALLKHFVNQFGDMPVLTPVSVGYGMGKKDFAMANCVRAVLGTSGIVTDGEEQIVELACNLDDMTAEDIGFAMEQLLELGVLDVFTQPIGMKKNRPGTMLTVLCRPEQEKNVTGALFLHTTTLGVRRSTRTRAFLTRHTEQVQTPYGSVQKKVSEGFGVRREKLEYEDLRRICREQGISLNELRKLLK